MHIRYIKCTVNLQRQKEVKELLYRSHTGRIQWGNGEKGVQEKGGMELIYRSDQRPDVAGTYCRGENYIFVVLDDIDTNLQWC